MKTAISITHTCWVSDSKECGSCRTVAKYHLQASKASAATASKQMVAEGRIGTITSAGKIFDFPSDKTNSWTSVAISIL